MKKIYAFILALLMLAVLAVPCFAEGEEPAPVEETTETETLADSAVQKIIDTLTTSSFWISLGTYLAAAVAVVAFVSSKFGGIANLIKSKADTASVKNAIKEAVDGAVDLYKAELAKVEAKLDIAETENEKLLTVLAIFFTNSKIPAAAQTEIVQILTEAKDAAGNLAETLDKVKETVEEEKAEAEANAPETPALDAITAEKPKENYGIGVI